jgi:hypothetical protein
LIQNEPKDQEGFKEIFDRLPGSKPQLPLSLHALFRLRETHFRLRPCLFLQILRKPVVKHSDQIMVDLNQGRTILRPSYLNFILFFANASCFVHFGLIQNEPKNQEGFKEIFDRLPGSKPQLPLSLHALFR